MDHPISTRAEGNFRLNFELRFSLEFYSSKISFDVALLLFLELDEQLGLSDVT